MNPFAKSLCAGLIVLASPAAAQHAHAPAAAPVDPAHKDCWCRVPGGRFRVGETQCVMGRMARCEMSQNVTSWTPTGESCPQAWKTPSGEAAARLDGG